MDEGGIPGGFKRRVIVFMLHYFSLVTRIGDSIIPPRRFVPAIDDTLRPHKSLQSERNTRESLKALIDSFQCCDGGWDIATHGM